VKILHSPLLKLKLKDKHFEEADVRNHLLLLSILYFSKIADKTPINRCHLLYKIMTLTKYQNFKSCMFSPLIVIFRKLRLALGGIPEDPPTGMGPFLELGGR